MFEFVLVCLPRRLDLDCFHLKTCKLQSLNSNWRSGPTLQSDLGHVIVFLQEQFTTLFCTTPSQILAYFPYHDKRGQFCGLIFLSKGSLGEFAGAKCKQISGFIPSRLWSKPMANSNMYRLIFLSKEDNLQVHRPDGFEHQKTNIFCNRFAIFRICILCNPPTHIIFPPTQIILPVQRRGFAGAVPWWRWAADLMLTPPADQ